MLSKSNNSKFAFNLTTLRKIASKNCTEKLKDVILQNHTLEFSWDLFVGKNLSPIAKF